MKRTQLKNPLTKTSTKRNKKGGAFMAVKKTAKKFKGVRREEYLGSALVGDSFGINLQIPTKPAMHSNSKPAGYSDLKPATRGVVRMGQFHDVVEGWEGQETG
jgi:hypothetical protein